MPPIKVKKYALVFQGVSGILLWAQANGPNLLSTLLPKLAGTLLFSYIFRVSHLPGDLWHVCLVFLLFHFGKKQQAGDLYRDEESLLLLLFAFSGDLNFVGLFASGSLRRGCYGKRGVRSHNLPGQLRNAECCPIWQPYLWQPIVAVNFSAVEEEYGAKCLETWEKVLKVAPQKVQLHRKFGMWVHIPLVICCWHRNFSGGSHHISNRNFELFQRTENTKKIPVNLMLKTSWKFS